MASIFPLFVPAIRDYIDIINNVYDSTVGNINFLQLLQQSLIYLIASIKFIIIYFFSLQWIQDLSYLPVVVPQIKMDILKEQFFLETPQSNFFTFLEIPSYTTNKFYLGFVNSFFLCLPLSVAHIISVRRLLIQGLFAGIFSSLGTICGQLLLLMCILLGGRFFVTSWFNFQILNYLIGFWVILKIVYDMCHERSIRIIESSNLSILIRIFLLNFTLAWTEQSCIFQYFGNLTFGTEPSIIEIFSSLSALQSILTHLYYISGIIVGTVFFTSFFILTTLKFSNACVQFLSILYSRWIRRLNFSLIVMIVAFTFTSIPFYSFDYLILSNFGFVAQDKSFQNTIFSPTKIYDFTPAILGDGNLLNNYVDQKPGIDTDIYNFNKGRYLMFDVNDSFEQLNYQGEYAWLTKKNRIPTISRDPSSSAVLSKVSKFFKKNKKPTTMPFHVPGYIATNEENDKNKNKLKYNKYTKHTNKLENTLNSNNLQNLNQNFAATEDKNDVLENQQNALSNIIASDFDLNSNSTENSINVLDSRDQTDRLLSESFEKLINASVSSKFFVNNPINKSIVEKKFQQRYYSNPIYKVLLSTDIDFFLSRQPKSLILSPKQEHELFKKRFILANYYDSLRYYNQLPYEEEFKEIFNGSKSYADRVYNHQFNGTLKIVRRLFSINENLNDQVIENKEKKSVENLEQKLLANQIRERNFQKTKENASTVAIGKVGDFLKKQRSTQGWLVLKFDQPLYKKINIKIAQIYKKKSQATQNFDIEKSQNEFPYKLSGDGNKIFFHEEFNLNTKSNNIDEKKKIKKTPLPQTIIEKNNLLNQLENDLSKKQIKTRSETNNQFPPFIELTNPTPFYVGWDEQVRKLVITNRLSPKRLTGESMKFFNKNQNLVANEYFGLNKLIKKNKTITFTTWPIMLREVNQSFISDFAFKKDNLQRFSLHNTFSYNFLVDSLQNVKNMNIYNNLVENDLELKIMLNENGIPTNAYGELVSIPTNILSKGGKPMDNQLQDIMPYTRGGFVWPGHSTLNFNFKKLMSNNLKSQ